MAEGRILVVNRRRFLAAGGGLALSLVAAKGAALAAENAPATDPAANAGKLSAYVQITREGRVIIVTPGAEMGQGIAGGLPKIVAEEMDADWERVEVRLSGADKAFANPSKRQRSANSDGMMSYYEPLRRVGASARYMLVGAAAARWSVPAAEVIARQGKLHHDASGRVLDFGEVAQDAAKIAIPDTLPLKNPSDFKLIGRDLARPDIPAKVTGKAVFGMDVVLPGMVYAAISHVPVAGGTLKGFPADIAKAMPGVRKVVQLDNAVAVVADSYWQAQKAVDAIELEVEAGLRVDSDVLRGQIDKALTESTAILPSPLGRKGKDWIMGATVEEIDAACKAAPHTIDVRYEVPYLAHAAMEPVCATALIEPGRCEIWAPLQAADMVPPEVAAITGLSPEAVTLHRTYLGGGFGRKNERDFVHQAVRLAMAMPGTPVMLIWSRQQDMRHDYYRPALTTRTRAAIAADGSIKAMHSRICGQPLMTMKAFRIPGFADYSVTGGLISDGYAIEAKRIDAIEIDAPIRTGYWRSVSASQNGFFSESAIDEIAAKLKRDPLDYRLWLARNEPRSLAVLKLAAAKAGWGTKARKGTGRGISLSTGWNSHCAQVVEAEVIGDKLTVKRIVCAFDCGRQIDPDNIINQIEGAIVFGLSAALHGQITFRDGAVVESTFADYPVVLMAGMPQIEVHLIETPDVIGGVGEAGVPGVAPALCGAIFAATGERIRRLPLAASRFEVTT